MQTTQNVDSGEMPFVAVYVILINEMGFRERLLFLKTQNVDSEGMPFLQVFCNAYQQNGSLAQIVVS